MVTRQAEYDLVLSGGTLLDPGQNINDRRDVAFKDGKVAAVAARIEPSSSVQEIDVTGKLVVPGLIDLHGHFYHGGTMTSTDADETCLPAGVTTGVDAGSAGWANYRAMRDHVFRGKVPRLLAFLNISATGLTLLPVVRGELQDMRHVDADRTADAIKENPGFLVGVKVRMATNAVSHWDAHTALRRARDAADKAGVTLMVHVSQSPIPLPDILEVMGPGDIATHPFHRFQEGILDKNGKIRPEVQAAVDRGVVMDLGDAGGNGDIEVIQAAIRQGLMPTTISTDFWNPPPDMGRVTYRQHELIGKLIALGQPMEDAVAAATIRPARALGIDHEVGSLNSGMEGDAAVFDLTEGSFNWEDGGNHTIEGGLRLDTFLTIRKGAIVWREGEIL